MLALLISLFYSLLSLQYGPHTITNAHSTLCYLNVVTSTLLQMPFLLSVIFTVRPQLCYKCPVYSLLSLQYDLNSVTNALSTLCFLNFVTSTVLQMPFLLSVILML